MSIPFSADQVSHGFSERGRSTTTPSLRPDYSLEQLGAWLRKHEELVELARTGRSRMVLFGDSLVAGWQTNGRAAWERYLFPLQAANFGVPGDRIQQLLWRLAYGELEGLSPSVVVVLIGTNNLDPGLDGKHRLPRNSVKEIIDGITAVVQTFRTHLPETQVLLHGLFPRGRKGAPVRVEIRAINESLQKLALDPSVSWLDLGPALLSPDGEIRDDITPDQLHLAPPGYEIWADALCTQFAQLLASTR